MKIITTTFTLSASLLLVGCGSHTADNALIGGAAGAGAGALIGGAPGAGIGGAIGAGAGALIGSEQDKQDREDGVQYQNPLD
ncbi:MAG: glycine zipper domain-containing protein [Planctomycetota bacterium]|nr:glycine zipper domain-containing protein [Planctomycetota bacterium]